MRQWICEECGLSFATGESRSRRFCSRACYHAYQPVAPELRFWRFVTKSDDPNGCWLWTGAKSAGYGTFGDKERAAHRWSYTHLIGPIDDGLELDHLCRVRACVNPAHLEPVPHRINVLSGPGPSAVAALKTHCLRGHPFDAVNTRITPKGARACRRCMRERARRVAGERVVDYPTRLPYGEGKGAAKLKEGQIPDIMVLHRAGWTPRELASRFGISSGAMRQVVNGTTWRYLWSVRGCAQ